MHFFKRHSDQWFDWFDLIWFWFDSHLNISLFYDTVGGLYIVFSMFNPSCCQWGALSGTNHHNALWISLITIKTNDSKLHSVWYHSSTVKKEATIPHDMTTFYIFFDIFRLLRSFDRAKLQGLIFLLPWLSFLWDQIMTRRPDSHVQCLTTFCFLFWKNELQKYYSNVFAQQCIVYPRWPLFSSVISTPAPVPMQTLATFRRHQMSTHFSGFWKCMCPYQSLTLRQYLKIFCWFILWKTCCLKVDMCSYNANILER